ncbi:MAG: Mov34/MPN/PAD-1 family protein [Balneola sp.]|nr:Mov34/MPN/PAD-1 family protein [Balneola sp.]
MKFVVKKEKVEFILPNRGILKISSEPLKILNKFRQIDISNREAGGVLLGRFVLDSDNIVIDKVTSPQSKDRRSRFAFKKMDSYHQHRITQEWTETGGKINYIGEWHSHPEINPNPSSLDIQEWKRKSKEDVYDNSFLIFIIVGIESISAWTVTKVDQSIIKLDVVHGKEKTE